MSELNIYLRCDRDHANAVPMATRNERVGTPCTSCGRPLLATPPRERPPFRGGRY